MTNHKQIAEELIKEIKNNNYNGICEFPNSPLTTGDSNKIIFLTTAEATLKCWKEEELFLNKLMSNEFTKGEIDGKETLEIKEIIKNISSLQEGIKLLEEIK